MKVSELMQHIEDGIQVFVSANGRKRVVVSAGWAWIEYATPSNPRDITCTFTEKFAKWAKRPEGFDSTQAE